MNEARRAYYDAPAGRPASIERQAQRLAGVSTRAATDLARLRPPENLVSVNQRLAANYTSQAESVQRLLDRSPLSTERLGDTIRKHGKTTDELYDQVLIAP